MKEQTIGKNIRRLRLEQNITPTESMDDVIRLAHRAGLSVTHYESETVDDLHCVYWCLTKA